MTHEQAITVLLRGGAGRSPGRGPEPGDRQQAEEHVARCSDCWAVLGLVHELATGDPPPAGERMATLYGCHAVQEELYLLLGLSADEIRATHPSLAGHLGWCHPCLERLAEILRVERAAAGGEFSLPLLARSAAGWREVAGRAGDTVREMIGRAVVEVRRAAATFTLVPDGVLVTAGAVPAGGLRGGEPARPSPSALGQQLHFALGDSGMSADLTLEPQGGDEVGIALRVSSSQPADLSLHLREVQGDRAQVIARRTLLGSGPVVVNGIRPGRYVVEIHERPSALVFRLRFDVERAM